MDTPESKATDAAQLEPVETDERAAALAAMLECDADEISEADYNDNTYEHGRAEYLVLTDEEADEKAIEQIRDSVWAFNASWIADYTPDGIDEDTIKAIQGDRCEDANAPLLALIEAGAGFDDFAESSMAVDGRGHFLAGYDNEEREQGEFYIYRTN